MKHYVYYLQNGEIVSAASLPDDAVPPTYDWCARYQTDGEIDPGSFKVVSGELVRYTSEGEALRLVPPGPYAVWSPAAEQWEDPRTLQDFKEAQWAIIKQARTSAEYSGFTWDGSTFDSDAISQNRITGAVTLAQMSPDFTIGWVLADNSVRTLNQVDMLQVGGALGQHVAAIFAKAAGLRAQIEAATTREAVESLVW